MTTTTLSRRETLEKLLERVRGATGPDRELDYDIHELEIGDWLSANAYRRTSFGYYSDTPPISGAAAVSGPPDFTASIDAALALVGRVLPGWWATCGLCALTGHASIGPDYNGPHRERLLREFPEERYDGGFHADLAPGDGLHRTALAICDCLLTALIAQETRE